jgi:hypothetical protein
MVVSLFKKGRQTMKNIITTIAMFILTITAQAQSVYKFENFYNYKHLSIWESPYAVNNDMDSNLGSGMAKCEMTLENKTITIKNYTSKNTFTYNIVSVENGPYTIYRTKCVESNNMDVNFYILDDGDKIFIYCTWDIDGYYLQGWQTKINK